MRIVGLDLGARHIAFCEVSQGKVVGKGSVRRLSELKDLLGPERGQARVAFEACREGWQVHDTLKEWGHEPIMLDTTRVRQIGVGHHGRKNDAIDAEVIAMALADNRVPLAHVLSPERRALRAKLSVRGELVDLRARQVTIIRGLVRAKGMLLPSSSTSSFLEHVAKATLDAETRALIAPLVATLTVAEVEIARLDAELAKMVAKDPMTTICATVPGVGIIVAATFVSVLDDAKRFRNAHAVASYLGLVPGEDTTGGKRRLGGITKQGNAYARATLVQAAWTILRAGDKDDPLHRWGSQIATKRGKKVAAVALARKLAGMLWAMCRDETVYEAAFTARESARGLKTSAQTQELLASAMLNVARKLHGRTRKAEAVTVTAPSPARRRKKTSTEAAV
jgi:transposase